MDPRVTNSSPLIALWSIGEPDLLTRIFDEVAMPPVVQSEALIRRRMVEAESVFGQVKGNRMFRRFLLRGLPKVNIEVGLLSVAHNLLKKAAVTMQPLAG